MLLFLVFGFLDVGFWVAAIRVKVLGRCTTVGFLNPKTFNPPLLKSEPYNPQTYNSPGSQHPEPSLLGIIV